MGIKWGGSVSMPAPRIKKSASIWLVITLLVVVGLALMRIAISLEGFGGWESIARELGAVLFVAGVLSFIYETWIREQLIRDLLEVIREVLMPGSVETGVTALYTDRSAKIGAPNGRNHYVGILKSAFDEIVFVGLDLTGLIPDHFSDMQILAKTRNHKYRLLVLDYECNESTRLIDQYFGAEGTSQRMCARLHASAICLGECRDRMAAAGFPKDSFQVRLYRGVAPWSFIGIDVARHNGRFLVEFNGKSGPPSEFPSVEIGKPDGTWYSYFQDQADALWKDSRDLPATSTIQSFRP